MIDLHYAATPNGQKVAIALEEVGFHFHVITYDISEAVSSTPRLG